MWTRLILAAVVLGLGIVGITLAQQTDERPKRQAADKAKLRAQVVKLRAEIDLIQLEHDADRGYLLELMRSVRQTEMIPIVVSMTGAVGASASVKMPGSVQMPRTEKEWMELEVRGMLGDQNAVEMFKKLYQAGEEANEKGEDAKKTMEAAAKELSSKKVKEGDVLQGYIDHKRKDYFKHAAELAEKQLNLEEVQRQYQKAE